MVSKVLRVEQSGNILIVIPQDSEAGFRYGDVQNESNLVLHLFDKPEAKHVILDLGSVDLMGSIMIGAIVRLFRKVSNGGGIAVMCGGSEQMIEVLENMRLANLWKILATRDDAIRHIQNAEKENA